MQAFSLAPCRQMLHAATGQCRCQNVRGLARGAPIPRGHWRHEWRAEAGRMRLLGLPAAGVRTHAGQQAGSSAPEETEETEEDPPPPSLMAQFMDAANSIFNSGNERRVQECLGIVEQIEELEGATMQKSDKELRAMADNFRQRLAAGETEEDILPEAYAVVREAAKRVLGLRAFDVQLLGGALLNDGCVTEMRTGEGKTLVATFPAYLNALSGKGVYVVTVNDFLAERDSQEMGRVYGFLGISCAALLEGMDDREYQRLCRDTDIIYVTAQRLGFNWLHDQTVMDARHEIFSRPFHFAIVDEVDSVLLDNSTTPLVIGRKSPDETLRTRLGVTDQIVRRLTPCPYVFANGNPVPVELQLDLPGDFTIDKSTNPSSVELTEEGQERAAAMLVSIGHLPTGSSATDLWDTPEPWGPPLLLSLKAHNSFLRDESYAVVDGQVKIVDANTGRVAEGSRWQDGLHQAIEVKEGLEPRQENETSAQITFQVFFTFFDKLSGLSGTAASASFELFVLYKMPVSIVPTHRPIRRKDHPVRLYASTQDKYAEIVGILSQCSFTQRPVLIGTESISESQMLLGYIQQYFPGMRCQLLNARPEYLRQEAEIVAQAGLPGTVTISTNMAGRGTDIKLGGDPRGLTKDALQRALLPHMIEEAEVELSYLPEFPFPINFDTPDGSVLGPQYEGQLFRAIAFMRASDAPKVSLHAGLDFIRLAMSHVDEIISESDRKGTASDSSGPDPAAIAAAEAIDGPKGLKTAVAAGLALYGFFKPICSSFQRQVVQAGGLTVIGASWMPSQRVADQLRGRAGRQGDPGESLLLCCPTDAMAPEWVSGIGMEEQLQATTKAFGGNHVEIENIAALINQKLYPREERASLFRQTLKDKDKIFQEFRSSIYKLRRLILTGEDEDVLDVLFKYMQDYTDELVAELAPPKQHPSVWRFAELVDKLVRTVNYVPDPNLSHADPRQPAPDGPIVQLDYLPQAQQAELWGVLMNGGDLPGHRSGIAATIKANCAIKRHRRRMQSTGQRDLLSGARYSPQAHLLSAYLCETLIMAFFEHEQMSAMLFGCDTGFVAQARKTHLLSILDDLYVGFLARATELQSGVSLQNPDGGDAAYGDLLKEDFTLLLQSYRRTCVSDVFRIVLNPRPVVTLSAEEFTNLQKKGNAKEPSLPVQAG